VADRVGAARDGQIPAAQSSFRLLLARRFRSDLLPQRADLLRSGHQDRRTQQARAGHRNGRLSGSWRRRDGGGADRKFPHPAGIARRLCAECAPAAPAGRGRGAGRLRGSSPSAAGADPTSLNRGLFASSWPGWSRLSHASVWESYLSKQKPRPLGRGFVFWNPAPFRPGSWLRRRSARAAHSRGPIRFRCNSCRSRRWRASCAVCR